MTDINENIINSYAYTPFGVLTESETIPQPFKYVGQYGVMHEPNGLYYMRARYYHPEFGRFTSEDPIGFKGGTINLYEYVMNNPVNWIDPGGLLPGEDYKPYPRLDPGFGGGSGGGGAEDIVTNVGPLLPSAYPGPGGSLPIKPILPPGRGGGFGPPLGPFPSPEPTGGETCTLEFSITKVTKKKCFYKCVKKGRSYWRTENVDKCEECP